MVRGLDRSGAMSTEWLPALLLMESVGNDWTKYLELLHGHFVADFVDSQPKWPRKRVGLKKHPIIAGKAATFWHFTSEGEVEADRIPCMRRCERIRWPRPMMDEFDAEPPGTTGCRVLWWKEERRGEERYLLAPADFSYVLVVADRGDYVLPWTAYPTKYPHQQRKRRNAYEAFWKAQKG